MAMKKFICYRAEPGSKVHVVAELSWQDERAKFRSVRSMGRHVTLHDLIRGDDWLRPVHHLPGYPFGRGPKHRLSIFGAVARHARVRPNLPFLTEIGYSLPYQTITYGQAHRRVQQRAVLLGIWGLKPGEIVGILGRNSIDFVLAVLGALEAGCVVALLNPLDPFART